jgi:hypothetical protein
VEISWNDALRRDDRYPTSAERSADIVSIGKELIRRSAAGIGPIIESLA